jgi:hypothetical protein
MFHADQTNIGEAGFCPECLALLRRADQDDKVV